MTESPGGRRVAHFLNQYLLNQHCRQLFEFSVVCVLLGALGPVIVYVAVHLVFLPLRNPTPKTRNDKLRPLAADLCPNFSLCPDDGQKPSRHFFFHVLRNCLCRLYEPRHINVPLPPNMLDLFLVSLCTSG